MDALYNTPSKMIYQSGIRQMPEATQAKMVFDVSHQYQFIQIKTC